MAPYKSQAACIVFSFATVAIYLLLSYKMSQTRIGFANPSIRPISLRIYSDKVIDNPECHMHSCFDYSRCSVLSGFPVYVYGMDQVSFTYKLDELVWSSVSQAFSQSPYLTNDPRTACIFLAVLGETSDRINLQRRLTNLQFWDGDGNNHVLLNIARTENDADMFAGIDTGKAIVVQSAFVESLFRDKFDIIIPPNFGKHNTPAWAELTPLSPIRRTYFLSYYDERDITKNIHIIQNTDIDVQTDSQHILRSKHENQTNAIQSNETKIHRSQSLRPNQGTGTKLTSLPNNDVSIIETLMAIQHDLNEKVYLNFSCSVSRKDAVKEERCVCDAEVARSMVLNHSTFSLIISPGNNSTVSTIAFQTRLFESLKYGAVPVILGDVISLPYAELLDWSKAAILLPKDRTRDLYTFLKNTNDNDIFELRRIGRMFWEKYFGSTSSILDTMLAVLRTRLLIPPTSVKDVKSLQINIKSQITQKSQPSVRYQRNFSIDTLRRVFNKPGDPFHIFPSTPFEPVLSSDAYVTGSDSGFVKKTAVELEGHHPLEQFTVVVPTYRRTDTLMEAIAQFKGCPYLSKVLVVWNDPVPPPGNISWPAIGVPLLVLNMTRNSLNNRFLPFDVIDTDAVFSMDDDSKIDHVNLVLGFRVWRENRDRLVGYPGRSHSWDKTHKKWLYRFRNSEGLSMALTGKAFFHKYYAYLYSYEMPQAIRDTVDKYTNCEDIAMNFLVSHITRKPPILVTDESGFFHGTGRSLSTANGHLEERNQCMTFFEKVYGYIPLLYTTFTANYI